MSQNIVVVSDINDYSSLSQHLFFYQAIFNGRNEVVAKVIFLHLFVILFTGGCWYLTRH